jgi:hypothetical protein
MSGAAESILPSRRFHASRKSLRCDRRQSLEKREPLDVAAGSRRLDEAAVPDQPRHLGCHVIRQILFVMRTPGPLLHFSTILGLLALAGMPGRGAEPVPAPAAAPAPARTPAQAVAPAAALPRTDANGNALRRAPTGHVSNYDEAKVGAYTLPDPLVLQSGQPVRDADTWFKQRRPEILRLYETEIYGRVPERAPKVTFEVAETNPQAMDGAAVRKLIVARFGNGPTGPKIELQLYLPTQATAPVPVLLHLIFGNPPVASIHGNAPAPGARSFPREAGPLAEILARGYGYALFRYSDIQPDLGTTNQSGVQALAYAPGQTKPAVDEWGTIAAWAWGTSRLLDHLETEPAVDAKRVALIGHSRLGKTVLWAGARDPRFALVFSSCSGEMGAALARRDFGETVDDMAASLGYQFAGNFQKYAGHWSDLPVDAHMLIALCAPRPVFITGGTQDQWADPRGEFLAEVAAGPVYRLLGQKDLGTGELPALDTPLLTGSLGFLYHTGGHTIATGDWKAFLDFADRHLQPKR